MVFDIVGELFMHKVFRDLTMVILLLGFLQQKLSLDVVSVLWPVGEQFSGRR